MSHFRFSVALSAPLAFVLSGGIPVALGQVADSSSNPMETVVVTAQHLNEERSHIQTQVGASTYTIDSGAIQAAPGGDNVLLNQVMLQVPDAAQDSFGQLHIRGDHNGLQFRLNGIILPDGISVFGQTLPPRLIDSMQMIMGSLPAQYGLRSAGIIDLTTKSGSLDPGGSITVYGGSHGQIEPSFDYGGFERTLHLLCDGRLPGKRPGDRVPRRQQRPAARSHQSASCLRLCRGCSGCEQPRQRDHRFVRCRIPDSGPARRAAITGT